MLKKLPIILAAPVLIVSILSVAGWLVKIRSIKNYLQQKYDEKFEFDYSLKEYIDNFRSRHLCLHWSDNAWSYPVIVTPANRPELKFTCTLAEESGSYYDDYIFTRLAYELRPQVAALLPGKPADERHDRACSSPHTAALPESRPEYLLDIWIKPCEPVEAYALGRTFGDLLKTAVADSSLYFPFVTLSLVFDIDDTADPESILDACIALTKDETLGKYRETGCRFVARKPYEEMKNNRKLRPGYLYRYMWPAPANRSNPSFYIHSGHTDETMRQRKQETLRAFRQYADEPEAAN